MNPMICHDDYEKLTDNVFFLGNNTIIRLNVILATKREDTTRYSYHQEYEYTTSKYINKNRVITLRRNFDYYLSIENLKSTQYNDKEFIMIRIQDMYHFIDRIHQASRWFIDISFKTLFATKNGKLTVLDRVEPIEMYINSKCIRLEPVVIDYTDNTIEGVRMFLNSDSNFIDIPVDRFMGLLYLMDRINLFESAQLLVNYLGRPEYGSNIYQFRDTTPVEQQGGVVSKTNRQIPNKETRAKSFFDD